MIVCIQSNFSSTPFYLLSICEYICGGGAASGAHFKILVKAIRLRRRISYKFDNWHLNAAKVGISDSFGWNETRHAVGTPDYGFRLKDKQFDDTYMKCVNLQLSSSLLSRLQIIPVYSRTVDNTNKCDYCGVESQFRKRLSSPVSNVALDEEYRRPTHSNKNCC